MSLDLSAHSAELEAAAKDVRDDGSETNWCIFGYDGKTTALKVVETGDDGLEGIVDEFNSGHVQYALVRVQDPNSNLNKYVFIIWTGEGATTSRKGMSPRHSRDVGDFFRGCHVTINATNEDDIDEEEIMDKVGKSGGAAYSNQEKKAAPKPQFANTNPDKVGTNYSNAYKKESTATTAQRGEYWNDVNASAEADKQAAATAAAQQEADLKAERDAAAAASEEHRAQQVAEREAEIAQSQQQAEPEPEPVAPAPVAPAKAGPPAPRGLPSPRTSLPPPRTLPSPRAVTPAAEPEADDQEEQERLAAEQEAAEQAALAEQEEQERLAAEQAAAAEQEEQERLAAEQEAAEQAAAAEQEEQERLAAEQEEQERLAAEQEAAEQAAAAEQQEAEADQGAAEDQGQCARALYDYQAQEENELTFDPDDIITHIDQIDEGWWQGNFNGNSGLFPANYVELI